MQNRNGDETKLINLNNKKAPIDKERLQNLAKLESLILNSHVFFNQNDAFSPKLPSDGFLYYDLKFSLIDKFKIYDKEVKKLRFLLLTQTGWWQGRLCIAYFDGSKKSTTISNSYCAVMEKIFKNLGAVEQAAFNDQKRNAINWYDYSMADIYKINCHNNPDQTYEILYQDILTHIIKIIKSMPLTNFNIIDGGCGSGKLLKLINKQLQDETTSISFNLLGFDFNQKNIDNCLNDNKNLDNNINFSCGNLLELKNVLEISQKDAKINLKYPTILILSGSITRLVLNNAFESAQVIQQASSQNIEYIIGGGQTDPMINYFMMKRIGYQRIEAPGMKGKSFFLYRKSSDDEILKNKRQKINNKKLLDLTLCPNPESILAKFIKEGLITDGLTIDLSFCEPTDDLITLIIDLNKKMKLKIIYWHYDINHYIFFNKHLKCLYGSVSARLVVNEGYLMAPKAFFLSLNNQSTLFNDASEFKDTLEFEEKYTVDNAINILLKRNNLADVKKLIGHSDTSNFRCANINILEILFDHASRKEAIHIILLILEKDSNLIARSKFMNNEVFTSLMKIIIDKRNYEIMNKLPIAQFVYQQCLTLIQLLENANMEINQLLDQEGNTLVHTLVSNSYCNSYCKSTIAILEKYPSLINFQNKQGITPLYHIINQFNHSSFELLNFILDKSSLETTEITDHEGMNLLQLAVSRGNLNIIEKLIKKNPNLLYLKDNQRRTAIHYAVLNGRYDIITILQKNGLDFFDKDLNGNFCLHTLFKEDSISKYMGYELFNFLRQTIKNYGKSIFFIQNYLGESPITLALKYNGSGYLYWSERISSWLKENEINVNQQEKVLNQFFKESKKDTKLSSVDITPPSPNEM